MGSVTRAAILAVALAACTPVEPFVCAGRGLDACGSGARCEPNGFCSAADDACASGRRYDDSAGEGLAGHCVGEDCAGGVCRCARSVAVGASHSCAVSTGGLLVCWGRNDTGQLGTGGPDSFVPQVVDDSRVASAVSAGARHTCAVLSGRPYCWGDGGSGRIGNGETRREVRPVEVLLDPEPDAVVAGGVHSCALADGDVFCFGSNTAGQLGDGTTVTTTVPVPSNIGGPVVELALGYYHSCARLQSGEVRCWGANNRGQAGGLDGTAGLLEPTAVPGVTGATSICAGDEHTCAATTDGQVLCWGANGRNQLGAPTDVQGATPHEVQGARDVLAVVCGPVHTCARRATDVLCWGENAQDQLGNPEAPVPSPTPVQVLGLGATSAVGAGALHTCAVTAAGGLHCWGAGAQGRLGLGTEEALAAPDLDRPVAVPCDP